MPATDVRFRSLFDGTGKVRCYGVECTYFWKALGTIHVSSGRLAAGDLGLAGYSQITFERQVPKGEHEVLVCVVTFPPENDERVALALLRFGSSSGELSAGPPTEIRTWRYAAPAGRKEDGMYSSGEYGYAVDSGTGGFFDHEAIEVLRGIENFGKEHLDPPWDQHQRPTWSWAILPITKELDAVGFSSGVGDGVYVSYFGCDEKGEALCIVTDFDLCEPPEAPK